MESLLLVLHFNSRPHGGRPFSPLASGKLFFISTHALTEGDGTAAAEKRLEEGISTHALTEGDLSGA